MSSREILKLKRVSSGAKVGVIAPASPADPDRVEAGISYLKNAGFKPFMPLNPSERFHDLGKNLTSADAGDRARVFMDMVEDEECELILSVRGGYGSMEILPFLDFKKIREARKPIVGYSDITALLAATFKHSMIPTIHGPALAAELACSETEHGGASCGSSSPSPRPGLKQAALIKSLSLSQSAINYPPSDFPLF